MTARSRCFCALLLACALPGLPAAAEPPGVVVAEATLLAFPLAVEGLGTAHDFRAARYDAGRRVVARHRSSARRRAESTGRDSARRDRIDRAVGAVVVAEFALLEVTALEGYRIPERVHGHRHRATDVRERWQLCRDRDERDCARGQIRVGDFQSVAANQVGGCLARGAITRARLVEPRDESDAVDRVVHRAVQARDAADRDLELLRSDWCTQDGGRRDCDSKLHGLFRTAKRPRSGFRRACPQGPW